MATYAHIVIHRFHWKPSEFLNMSDEEQAFVIASIDEKIEAEEKEAKKLKK